MHQKMWILEISKMCKKVYGSNNRIESDHFCVKSWFSHIFWNLFSALTCYLITDVFLKFVFLNFKRYCFNWMLPNSWKFRENNLFWPKSFMLLSRSIRPGLLWLCHYFWILRFLKTFSWFRYSLLQSCVTWQTTL